MIRNVERCWMQSLRIICSVFFQADKERELLHNRNFSLIRDSFFSLIFWFRSFTPLSFVGSLKTWSFAISKCKLTGSSSFVISGSNPGLVMVLWKLNAVIQAPSKDFECSWKSAQKDRTNTTFLVLCSHEAGLLLPDFEFSVEWFWCRCAFFKSKRLQLLMSTVLRQHNRHWIFWFVSESYIEDSNSDLSQ